MKYSWEFKLECVGKYKNGECIATLGKKKTAKGLPEDGEDWAEAYDDLGGDGLKHSPMNKR